MVSLDRVILNYSEEVLQELELPSDLTFVAAERPPEFYQQTAVGDPQRTDELWSRSKPGESGIVQPFPESKLEKRFHSTGGKDLEAEDKERKADLPCQTVCTGTQSTSLPSSTGSTHLIFLAAPSDRMSSRINEIVTPGSRCCIA